MKNELQFDWLKLSILIHIYWKTSICNIANVKHPFALHNPSTCVMCVCASEWVWRSRILGYAWRCSAIPFRFLYSLYFSIHDSLHFHLGGTIFIFIVFTAEWMCVTCFGILSTRRSLQCRPTTGPHDCDVNCVHTWLLSRCLNTIKIIPI